MKQWEIGVYSSFVYFWRDDLNVLPTGRKKYANDKLIAMEVSYDKELGVFGRKSRVTEWIPIGDLREVEIKHETD